MPANSYEANVFINCPFDPDYEGLFQAVVFAVMDCGFRPRCALEIIDSGQNRLDKIVEIIKQSRFGIHDLSRTELDAEHRLPRFNMPFELGLFIAAQRFGAGRQRQKVSPILDREPYRYQKFLSDIAGQDPASHNNKPHQAIIVVPNWLKSHFPERTMPGGERLGDRYSEFSLDLPRLCGGVGLNVVELTFVDYTHLAGVWLREHP